MDYTMTEAILLAQRESIEAFARRFRELTGWTIICRDMTAMATPEGDFSFSFRADMPSPPTAADVLTTMNFDPNRFAHSLTHIDDYPPPTLD